MKSTESISPATAPCFSSWCSALSLSLPIPKRFQHSPGNTIPAGCCLWYFFWALRWGFWLCLIWDGQILPPGWTQGSTKWFPELFFFSAVRHQKQESLIKIDFYSSKAYGFMTHKCHKWPLWMFIFFFCIKHVFLLNRMIDWLINEKQSCITAEFNT